MCCKKSALALIRIAALLATLAATAPMSGAHAALQDRDATETRQVSATLSLGELVEQMLQQGRLSEAQDILVQIASDRPGDVQVRFLSGLVAVASKNYQKAIGLFRSILIDHPDATRVRLELARAFFLNKDYANADRQFRFARAGNPPREVGASIDQYLYAIRQSKSWSYQASVAIAPDTNVNVGTSSHEVTLYGLPFDLSGNARKHSGIGLAFDLGTEFAPPIGERARLRMGVNAQRREYSGGDFDEMNITAYAGPRFVSERWDASLLTTAFQRWYGGRAYSRAIGARGEANYYLTPQTSVSASLSAQKLEYPKATERDGWILSANAGVIYTLDPTSAITFKTGINRQDARMPAYSNWSGYVAAGYYRDLPGGFSLYLEPSLARSRYDEALPVFGIARSDRSVSALVTILNRKIILSRFTPRISYSFTQQSSNIALYRFTRNKVEIGLTTSF